MKSTLKTLCMMAAFAAAVQAQSSVPPTAAELAALKRMEPQRAEQGMRYLVDNLQRNGLDARYSFRHVSSITDPWGNFHGRYREYYDGLRLVGGNAIVHIDRNGQTTKPTLKLFNGVYISTTPVLTQAEAIAKATAAYDPTGRVQVETSAVELLIHVDSARVDHGPAPTGADASTYKRYETVARSFLLVWQVGLSSTDGNKASRVYLIDANNGRVFREIDPRDHAWTSSPGTGASYFSGPVTFNSVNVGFGPAPYWSVDPATYNGFLNARYGTSEKASSYAVFDDVNNKWGDGVRDNGTADPLSKRAQTAYVDARHGLDAGWNLLAYFGRNGWDGGGRPAVVRLHWNEKSGETYTDAHWHPSVFANREGMFLGDGSTSTSLSTVAHELGHGFFDSVFGWSYKPDQEWRGLNEGDSDVMGTLAEMMTWKAPGEKGPFTQMDGEWRWDARMINPAGYSANGQTGYSYWNDYLGDKEEHTVGCLFGHVFIFMADGASPFTASSLYSGNLPQGLTGMGVERAAFYWYWAVAAHLPEKGDYLDLHEAFLAAADSNFSPQGDRNIIEAAFRGIAAGGVIPTFGEDGQAPTITDFTINKIDEAAGYAEVDVTAFDNFAIARVDVFLDESLQLSDTRLPYGGPVNLVGAAPGRHTIRVVAHDITGHESTMSKDIVLYGTRELIKNGGFEKLQDWGYNSRAGIAYALPDTNLPFAGLAYMRMSGAGKAWQDLTIPPAATSATLRYRVRMDGHHPTEGYQSQHMYVELHDSKNDHLLKVLAEHDEADETFESPLTHTYKQVTVPIAQRGDVQLLFRVDGGSGHRFKVDNVSITYTETPAAKVSALVRAGEQTVEFSTTYSGIDPQSIQKIEYYLDDAYTKQLPPAGAGLGPVLISTKGLAAKTHSVTAVIRAKQNQAEIVKAGVFFNVPSVTNLIQNGEFEEGFNHWPATGGANVVTAVLDSNPCFMGERCGVVGSNTNFPTSTLSQPYTLSKVTTGLTLSYRLRVRSVQPGNKVVDKFHVYIVDPSNKAHDLGDTYSNLTNTSVAGSYDGFIAVTEKLPGNLFQAGTYRLVFESTQDASGQTNFFVDTVALVQDGLIFGF